MQYKVGQSYYKEFVTSAATGEAVNADALPVAIADKNGVADPLFVLTISNLDTGRYSITGTIPAYTIGDVVNISVSATIGGIAAKNIVETIMIVDPLNASDSRLDSLDAPISGIPTNPVLTNDARLDFLDASVAGIPTNPVLETDLRLDTLDAPISGIPTNPVLTNDARLDSYALDATVAKETTLAGALTILGDLRDVEFGRWVLDTDANTLTKYRANDEILIVFDLTVQSVPKNYGSRTPQ